MKKSLQFSANNPKYSTKKNAYLIILTIITFLCFLTSCNNEPSAEYVYVDYNDGSQVTETLIIKEGKITLPRSPQRSGYDFDGWEVNGNVYEYPDTVQVSNGTTITAKWTQLHTVTIDYGIEDLASVTQSIRHGDEFELPSAPAQATKNFEGWRIDWRNDFGQPKDKIKIVDDIIIRAIWNNKANHTVNIEMSDGVKYAILVRDGDSVELPTSMTTRTGYSLSWTLNGKAYDLTNKVTSDLSIIGTWAPISYTVTFNSNGGSAVASQTVDYNSYATAPDNPTKTGCIFVGWTLEDEDYNFSSTPISGSITLNAKWTEIKTNVTLFFPKDVNEVESIKVEVGTVTKMLSYAKDGISEEEYYKYSFVVTGLDYGTYDIKVTTFKGSQNIGSLYSDSVTLATATTNKDVKIETSNFVDLSVKITTTAKSVSGDSTSGYVISGVATLSYTSDVASLYYSLGDNEPTTLYVPGTELAFTNSATLKLKVSSSDSVDSSKLVIGTCETSDKIITFSTGVGATGPAGGTIFYDAKEVKTYTYTNSAGESISYSYRFFEASPDVLSDTYEFKGWGTFHKTWSNVGAGKANTARLKETMTDYDNNSAAKACVSYSGGGFTDWFLPSEGEYSEMYKIKDKINGIKTDSNSYYWSSTELQGDKNKAMDVSFSGSKMSSAAAGKTSLCYVRPVRCF